jgi:hypothetical protein
MLLIVVGVVKVGEVVSVGKFIPPQGLCPHRPLLVVVCGDTNNGNGDTNNGEERIKFALNEHICHRCPKVIRFNLFNFAHIKLLVYQF